MHLASPRPPELTSPSPPKDQSHIEVGGENVKPVLHLLVRGTTGVHVADVHDTVLCSEREINNVRWCSFEENFMARVQRTPFECEILKPL
ncbi:hypothetical protein E2C01_063014 [Portunus trituberculatus]|uniref:Uncharacterized protein n=1 Tax=Portunus trituberculatus TaxID=210409 RepID=A0A5B7HJN6_PORTR|nr:hypothetical protein [Portunus trituberculatus]